MILSIETSCDETAASIAKPCVLNRQKCAEIVSSVVASQIDIHKIYGGIIPEVAARAHVEKILPVIDQALVEAGIGLDQVEKIAVTWEPGLMPSLMVGRSAAQALSIALKKPLIRTDHIMGHIYANWIVDKSKVKSQNDFAESPQTAIRGFKVATNDKRLAANKQLFPRFPAVALVVSGGHSGLWLLSDFGKEKQLGSTLDDAAGEAFDKAARLLDLGYPGGPAISKAAEKGNSKLINFPRPKMDSKDFDFSFSGLKTAIVREIQIRGEDFVKKHKNDFAASIEQAIVDTLTIKSIKAAKKYCAKSLILAGGVAANTKLRNTLSEKSGQHIIQFFTPDFKYCTDNAAMIAAAAILRR